MPAVLSCLIPYSAGIPGSPDKIILATRGPNTVLGVVRDASSLLSLDLELPDAHSDGGGSPSPAERLPDSRERSMQPGVTGAVRRIADHVASRGGMVQRFLWAFRSLAARFSLRVF
jgi:hypothetical protein